MGLIPAGGALELFAEAVEPATEKPLDDATRAAFMLAIIGILVLGIGGSLIIWLFGRMYQRWNGVPGPTQPSGASHLGKDLHATAKSSVAQADGDD